jgi:hypothetical protein
VKEITTANVARNDRTCIFTAGLIEGWKGGVDERWGEGRRRKKKRSERCLLKRSRAGRRSAKLQGRSPSLQGSFLR